MKIFSIMMQASTRKILFTPLFMLNIITVFCLSLDFGLHNIIYPLHYIRCGKVFRAVKVVLESNEIKKTLKSIIRTIPQILDVIVIIVVIILAYALLGTRLLDTSIEGTTAESDFRDMGIAS